MSKTTVAILTADVKLLVDYNITDTDLDNLILKGMNFAVKRMKQWFLDERLYDEIGAHDTLTTTTLVEYIDIATETPDLDQAISLSERTNDNTIEIITFREYRQRYPDPSANSSETADVGAFFGNRLYLGPTPSATGTIYYLDYIKLITKLTSGGTLPYEDKYDELVVAMITEYLVKFLDRGNQNMINSAKLDVRELKHDLITGASKNIGMNQQVQSRKREMPYFAPRKVIT